MTEEQNVENPYVGRGARFALFGLDASIRLVGSPDFAPQIVLGQALFWAATIDELLAHKIGTEYETAREGDADGAAIQGVRIARNAVTHGMVIVEKQEGGLAFPLEFSLSFGESMWVSLEQLLSAWTPKQTRHLAAQKESYRKHFEMKSSIEPLVMARRWFSTAAQQGFGL